MQEQQALKEVEKVRYIPIFLKSSQVQSSPAGRDVLVYKEFEVWRRYAMIRVHVREVDVYIPETYEAFLLMLFTCFMITTYLDMIRKL